MTITLQSGVSLRRPPRDRKAPSISQWKPEDGKKRFPGKVVPIRSIANTPIEIHDYEADLTTAHGDGRYLVSFRNIADGTFNKFFTASKEMQNILDQISDIEDGFPFETTIVMDYYDGKTLPKFT
ncbi:hypothetical protein EEL40_00395 [Muribaculaceae bacterium Isolate-083 (Janvier)]|uniref:hypothetical protein n=1 Tax=Muribaculaceae TaxID=2005473 RepID=UPI000F4AA4E4|nr:MULTISPECIES: hypothetical protein [Muribaculaceae]ROS99986.1 hypothetical protein EEL37_01410 [Muribaculaceae bacterium Isolate-077 (Janvier)]ROT00723.1 hypothetical protein EEL40_00395 [Muribaculaceae bacterium Isolate-083 (Janvier)]ROT02483.1 hypothetical protein EEL41_01410 [Muribaculaceae bacterium Isolate-084 (Janvier)]